MQKKYLKKMVAVMLATMTVSATPGLVGAMNEESKKIIHEVNSKIQNRKLTKDEATDMLGKLEEMAKEDDEAKKEVSETLMNLSSQNLFERDSLNQILNILEECSKYNNHARYIATTIKNMAVNRMFESDSLNRVLNVLHACSKYEGFDLTFVLQAIEEMANKDILDNQSINETLMQILQKCSECRDSKSSTAYAIDRLAQRNLLNQCSPDKLKRIIDALLSCLGNGVFDAKASVFSAIKTMAYKNVLEKCDADQIYKIACISIDHMGDEGSIIWDSVDSTIDCLANKNLLNKCTASQVQQIISSLTKSLENNKLKCQSTTAIRSMSKAGLLNECNPAKLQQMLNLLKIHLKDYLAEVNDENYEMVDKILEVLKVCSKIDALKADVSDIANGLAQDETFYPYLNKKLAKQPLGDILEISTSCSKIQNHETQAKAVSAVANVLKRLDGEIDDWSVYQIKANFQNIMEMLEEFSKIDNNNQDIATIINCLSQEEIFNATVRERFGNETPLDTNKLWAIL